MCRRLIDCARKWDFLHLSFTYTSRDAFLTTSGARNNITKSHLVFKKNGATFIISVFSSSLSAWGFIFSCLRLFLLLWNISPHLYPCPCAPSYRFSVRPCSSKWESFSYAAPWIFFFFFFFFFLFFFFCLIYVLLLFVLWHALLSTVLRNKMRHYRDFCFERKS